MPSDGLGWWLNVVYRVARDFGLHPDRVAMEMPLAQVFAWNACSIENDPWAGSERASPGYIAQEVERRLKAKG